MSYDVTFYPLRVDGLQNYSKIVIFISLTPFPPPHRLFTQGVNASPYTVIVKEKKKFLFKQTTPLIDDPTTTPTIQLR